MSNLNQIHQQAQKLSSIIQKFQTKQSYKFKEFVYIPQDPNEYLESITLFETGHNLSIKDIIYDLTLNIPPLTIFDYANYIENLTQSTTSEEEFVEKLLSYKDYLSIFK